MATLTTSALLIFGPPGSGKTTNAEALRRHYRKARVVDFFDRGDPIPPGKVLLLGIYPDRRVSSVPIAEALAAAGLAGRA